MDVLNETIQGASDSIGVPAAALKFTFSLLISLPVCFIIKEVSGGQSPAVKHICYSLAGLALSYFNYGFDTIHFIISIFINFVLLRLIGGTATSVAISFLFNMGYLLTAYMILSTDDYDMIWTTPQCILTLRMIGVAYDLYDGHRPEEELSKEQKTLFIKRPPSCLELLSASMFPGGFFAGPQFSFRMYLDFISERGIYKAIYVKDSPSRLGHAISMVVLGISLTIIYAVGEPYCGINVIASSDFENSPALTKVLLFMAFGFHFYFKYIGFWLITEAVCVAAGLSYNGTDDKGNHQWDALIGVRIYDLLTANTFREHILTFNLTTNLWTSRYVYKRCKFLGNRHLSQAISLFFLASWHGLYLGYHLCFMLEMLYIMVEDELVKISDTVPSLKKLKDNPSAKLPIYLLTKAWMTFFWAYPIVSFVSLRFYRIHHIWKQFYYVGHVVYGAMFLLLNFVIMPQMRKMKKKEEKEKLKKSD